VHVAAVSAPDSRLEEIVRRLAALYTAERIYLFGSRARGDADVDSDYDLLVVVPDDSPPEFKGAARAYDTLWTLGTAADVLVWTRTAFDRRAHLKASLPGTVLREGVLLYGG
jgi:predicted nucleotidyltransferase